LCQTHGCNPCWVHIRIRVATLVGTPVSFPTNRIRAPRHVGGHWMVTVVAVSVSSLFVAVVAVSEGPLGRNGRFHCGRWLGAGARLRSPRHCHLLFFRDKCTYASFIEGICVGLAGRTGKARLLHRKDASRIWHTRCRSRTFSSSTVIVPLKLMVRSELVVDIMDVECFEFSHVRGTEVGEAWEDHGDGECGEFF